jgi:hypothetical protein
LLVAASFIVHVLWPRWPAPSLDKDAPPIPVIVAGVSFNVPPAAIRKPVQRAPGMHERLDLSFLWPSLEPPGVNEKLAVPAAVSPAPTTFERIFVTIAAAGSSIPPSEHLATIYAKYTAVEASPGPSGLIILAFRDGTPYQGEDLIYDAPDPGFLVRCTRQMGVTPGTCLYERWIETAQIVVRFPREWLADWQAVSANVSRLITSLRPADG